MLISLEIFIYIYIHNKKSTIDEFKHERLIQLILCSTHVAHLFSFLRLFIEDLNALHAKMLTYPLAIVDRSPLFKCMNWAQRCSSKMLRLNSRKQFPMEKTHDTNMENNASIRSGEPYFIYSEAEQIL